MFLGFDHHVVSYFNKFVCCTLYCICSNNIITGGSLLGVVQTKQKNSAEQEHSA